MIDVHKEVRLKFSSLQANLTTKQRLLK